MLRVNPEPRFSSPPLKAGLRSWPRLSRRGSVGERVNGVRLFEISYASPKGGRVPAYLVVPAGKGLFPAILYGPWGYGTRTEFLSEALLYAEAGVVSLLVDYPWVRPLPWRKNVGDFRRPESDHEAYIQAVIERQPRISPFIFDMPNRHQPDNLRRTVRRIKKLSGVEYFHLHLCRHYAMTARLAAGVDIQTGTEVLGHSRLSTSLLYAHTSPERKLRAVEAISIDTQDGHRPVDAGILKPS